MPPRLERRHNTGNLHFITFSCQDRNPYLELPTRKSLFLSTLEATRKRYAFDVFAYVIMPEHIHLLISEPPEKPLSLALAVLKRTFSVKFPESPFWLPRYHDFNIFTNAKLIEKLKYIHRNPVIRGLAPTPEAYQWSSFRAYAQIEQSPVIITRAT